MRSVLAEDYWQIITKMLKSYHHQGCLEAGCDEAGRGCLAGAVFAAAVILPPDFAHPLINDSKTLTDNQRRIARTVIEDQALAWAVAHVSSQEIDEINILNASFKAMNLAIRQLSTTPDLLLIDGNRFKNQTDITHVCIVKGDATYLSIAAASILAKTYRDDYMLLLDKEFPVYQWRLNKGYPTSYHRNAIQKHGTTPHHRQSFRLVPKQLSIDFR
jgi:ribonuclease HII